MTNKEKMRQHLAKVEEFVLLVDEIEKVIDREVEQAYGTRIRSLRTSQEQDNVRKRFTQGLADTNPWLKRATGNRGYHIAMATMYGIATLVDEQEVALDSLDVGPINRLDDRDIW